jgi:deferrochelatase/peroxidase EfeB
MHAFITIVLPFAGERADDVDAVLDRFGNPASDGLRGSLDRCGLVHFMSATVVRSDAMQAYLVWEMSVDGAGETALTAIVAEIGDRIAETLSAAGIDTKGVPLRQFLAKYCHDVGTGWFSTPGLTFAGAPGMSVERIKAEAALATRIGALLETLPRSGGALQTLERVRATLMGQDDLSWAFKAAPAPVLNGPQGTVAGAARSLILGAFGSFLWPVAIVVLAVLVLGIAFSAPSVGWARVAAISAGVLILEFFALIAAAAFVYVRFRAAEDTDAPDDSDPSSAVVAEIMRRENHGAQNHLAGVSIVKPGILRRFTLRIAFFVIGVFASRVYSPGQLGELGNIHFARWILLPGADRLLFFSNYDGSWEAYLENFIEQAHAGLTGVWSNTLGYPRTRNLFQDGATDGDRFKRWARRQQHPTRFWYSAYPSLTMSRIRTNAAIRQGLAAAALETEAADWLACFGTAPSPASYIEASNVQTLIHGGLAHLPFAACILGRFSDDSVAARRWLREIAPSITFGSAKFAEEARLVAFTCRGLAALGQSESHLATFPVAFQHGMSAPWRSRMLGDFGSNDPTGWLWGSAEQPVDVAVLVYATSADTLAQQIATESQRLKGCGHDATHIIRMAERPSLKGPTPEPFGFEDGLSQPIISGLRQARPGAEDHIVAPGEFILGYPDNRGFLPPTPRVPAIDDPWNILPALAADPSRQRPNFSDVEPNLDHDLGRNGAFLVIRQLEQHIAVFNAAIAGAVASLSERSDLPVDKKLLPEWIGAKIVGRWKNGNPLVTHPFAPGEPSQDNSFRYGVDDPVGLRCPFGAHIRRANPRDAFDPESETQLAITNRHRILRIGRPYEPAGADQDPGLLFMCLNADIQRQFEFLQQSWILSPNFQGLENETDPVFAAGEASAGRFSIPTPSGTLCLSGLKDFVTVLGGAYFFLPGRQAVAFLGGS